MVDATVHALHEVREVPEQLHGVNARRLRTTISGVLNGE